MALLGPMPNGVGLTSANAKIKVRDVPDVRRKGDSPPHLLTKRTNVAFCVQNQDNNIYFCAKPYHKHTRNTL